MGRTPHEVHELVVLVDFRIAQLLPHLLVPLVYFLSDSVHLLLVFYELRAVLEGVGGLQGLLVDRAPLVVEQRQVSVGVLDLLIFEDGHEHEGLYFDLEVLLLLEVLHFVHEALGDLVDGVPRYPRVLQGVVGCVSIMGLDCVQSLE